MILNDKQKQALAESAEAFEAWKAAKAARGARLRDFEAQLIEEEKPLWIRWVVSAYRANSMRVPAQQIAEKAMGMVGKTSAYAAIRDGEQYANAGLAVASTQRRVVWNDGIATYTPSAALLAEVCQKLGKDPADAPQSAQFQVVDGKLSNVTERFVPDFGMHPVVALVMAEGSSAAEEILNDASVAR